MPTVLRIKGYRFFFFSNEGAEPIDIHVEKAEGYAKLWLNPITIATNSGFSNKELKEISHIMEMYQEFLKTKWDEFFTK
jgi:hypothetical protein